MFSLSPECLQLTVQPDEVSTVTLSTSLSLSECGVCALNDQGVEDCATSQKIEPSQNVTVRLNCTEPEKTISVLIESRIGEKMMSQIYHLCSIEARAESFIGFILKLKSQSEISCIIQCCIKVLNEQM